MRAFRRAPHFVGYPAPLAHSTRLTLPIAWRALRSVFQYLFGRHLPRYSDVHVG